MLIRPDSVVVVVVVVVGTAGWCSIYCRHSRLLMHCQAAILTQINAEFDGKNKKATNNCMQWKKTGFKRRMSEFPCEIYVEYKIFGHIYDVTYIFQEADPVSAINH